MCNLIPVLCLSVFIYLNNYVSWILGESGPRQEGDPRRKYVQGNIVEE